MPTKKCPRCNTWKLNNEFTLDSSRQDGLCYLCRDCKRQDTKTYYQNHPEAMRRNQKLYREKHADLANVRSRRWNHEHRRGYSVSAILEVYGTKCHLCGDGILPKHFSIDHVIPLSLGGNDDFSNLRPAHRSCNSSKGNRITIKILT